MKNLFLLLVLGFCTELYGQNIVFKSSEQINSTYLIFYSSLNATNKTNITSNLILKCTSHWQPSGRFFAEYNSTSTLKLWSSYLDKVLKPDSSTTRMLIIIDAKLDSVAQAFVTAGKARKIKSLFLQTCDNTKTNQKSIKRAVWEIYEDYEPVQENKDWCLYEVDPK